MLKYENIAKPGDRIRAYDFRGRKDCYVEGIVQSTNSGRSYAAFVIVVDVDVLADYPPHRIGQIVYVPMELGFMEYDGRIENLEVVRNDKAINGISPEIGNGCNPTAVADEPTILIPPILC